MPAISGSSIPRESRRQERRAGRDSHRAVALIKPFRLHADLALLRLAGLDTHAEHLHGIGQRLFAIDGELLVHGIARRGGAEMGKAGAREMKVRGVGVIDRRDQPALAVGSVEVDGLAEPLALDQRG